MGICLTTQGEEKIEPGEVLQLKQQKPDSFQNLGEEEAEQAQQIDLHDEGEPIDGGTGGLSSNSKPIQLSDFEFIKVLGRGSFGKVMLVSYKQNTELYAMKILRKDMIEKRNQKLHTQNERAILENVKHPFIVQLHFAFQTQVKLYLIMDFMIGGELFFHLRRAFRFTEERAKFYCAELALALEYLHKKGIVYRDLKPENILLGQDGHLKLTDFGLSKPNLQNGEKTNTFCGTPEYLAPEILLGQGHNQSVDWWSLGALLYEMLAGAPPFYSKDKTQMFRNRLEKPIEMKQWFSPEAISILQGLLNNNQYERLGANGSQDVRSHPFFKGLDWDSLLKKQIEPPFKPKVFNKQDLRHFDQMFTDEPVYDTPLQSVGQMNESYDKFTYMKNIDNPEVQASYVKLNNMDKYVEVNPNFDLSAKK